MKILYQCEICGKKYNTEIEDRPLWGHNQSWDWAEFQIDHFMIGYLLEKKNG